MEALLVLEQDRDWPPVAFVTLPPARWQYRPAGTTLKPVVAGVVGGAQAHRGVGHVGADRHEAVPVAGHGLLFGQPLSEVRSPVRFFHSHGPPPAVPLAEPKLAMGSRPLRADPTRHFLHILRAGQRLSRADELGLAHPAISGRAPLQAVDRAQLPATAADPLTTIYDAFPPIERMPARDPNHLGEEDRVEGRGADQCGQDLQPIPDIAIRPVGIQRE